jgi:hypothetical protein
MIPEMFSYRFELLDNRGAVASGHHGLFGSDEAAIDHAGCIDHRHAVRVWRRSRCVAHLPALRGASGIDEGLTVSDLRLLRQMTALTVLQLGLDLPTPENAYPAPWLR